MKKLISLILCFLIGISALSGVVTVSAQEDPSVAPVGVSMDDPMIVPRIVVTTANGNGTSLLKSDGYVNANISITDMDGSVLSDACTIKVRGNTTAFDSIPKKAYTFKFEKKKDVLGMGKGKKWALLANCYDPTLLRNYLANDMAADLGLDYTCQQQFVRDFDAVRVSNHRDRVPARGGVGEMDLVGIRQIHAQKLQFLPIVILPEVFGFRRLALEENRQHVIHLPLLSFPNPPRQWPL